MIRKADKELKERWLNIFNALSPEAKLALKAALEELRKDALAKSAHSWAKHKAPMALYWKVVGVYAGHIARAIEVNACVVCGKEPAASSHGKCFSCFF